jgi:hypothetical protein
MLYISNQNENIFQICGVWSEVPGYYIRALQKGELSLIVTTKKQSNGAIGGTIGEEKLLANGWKEFAMTAKYSFCVFQKRLAVYCFRQLSVEQSVLDMERWPCSTFSQADTLWKSTFASLQNCSRLSRPARMKCSLTLTRTTVAGKGS